MVLKTKDLNGTPVFLLLSVRRSLNNCERMRCWIVEGKKKNIETYQADSMCWKKFTHITIRLLEDFEQFKFKALFSVTYCAQSPYINFGRSPNPNQTFLNGHFRSKLIFFRIMSKTSLTKTSKPEVVIVQTLTVWSTVILLFAKSLPWICK